MAIDRTLMYFVFCEDKILFIKLMVLFILFIEQQQYAQIVFFIRDYQIFKT